MSTWKLLQRAWCDGARSRGRFGHLKTAGAALFFPVRVGMYNLGYRLRDFGSWLIKTSELQ